MTFGEQLWHQVGITWWGVLGVVVATVALYAVFALVIRWTGQRLYANRSATGLAAVMVLGAVAGRSMLGSAPTLMGGLIALATLVLLERLVGKRFAVSKHAKPRRAVVVLAHGHFRPEVLEHYHLSEGQVLAALRAAKVVDMDGVWAVILEANGSLSVLPQPVDPRLLTGVRGREFLRMPTVRASRTPGTPAVEKPTVEP